MPVFVKHWVISGSRRLVAKTAEQADIQFMAIEASELADDGELKSEPAVEEIRDDEPQTQRRTLTPQGD